MSYQLVPKCARCGYVRSPVDSGPLDKCVSCGVPLKLARASEIDNRRAQALSNSSVQLQACTVLGGSGYSLQVGESVDLLFGEKGVAILVQSGGLLELSFVELDSVLVSGPGAVTSGGGFVGGGFGVESAVEGIAVATLLNKLTTRTSVHTFLTLITNVGELHLHYAGMEPNALRIALSPVFTFLRRLDASWVHKRIQNLELQRDRGAITELEFASLRSRLP